MSRPSVRLSSVDVVAVAPYRLFRNSFAVCIKFFEKKNFEGILGDRAS